MKKNLNLERSFVTVIKTDDNGTHDLLDYSDVVLKDYSMFGKKKIWVVKTDLLLNF